MFSATVVADSISPVGKRLTTLFLEYPRFVHAELMTHRVFSRNAASSRAIPVKKMLERIKNDPAMPVWWGKNQPGMQAEEELDETSKKKAQDIWLLSRDLMVKMAEDLNDLGLHKQIANRILEPWMYIGTLVTATEWDNFKALRRHRAAQPEMRRVADLWWSAYEKSEPAKLWRGEWHLPFISKDERKSLDIKTLVKYSVARCARTSYLNHDGSIDPAKDLALHDQLLDNGHMSPFEHQARVVHDSVSERWYGNFRGWEQYRKLIPGEAIFEDTQVAATFRKKIEF